LDDCHGAGNCCRVPFDLVYTEYDKSRIDNYHHEEAVATFGAKSSERFNEYRSDLLDSLQEAHCYFKQGDRQWSSKIYVKINNVQQQISGRKSCPYLFVGDDRYFCGAHPFKPLHCWYPHMTVRVGARSGCKPSVSIGRMQYGRNHKFGCPVQFIEPYETDDLFEEATVSYFDDQYQSDIAKLAWTAKSCESLGFDSEMNLAVDLDNILLRSKDCISNRIANRNHSSIDLWVNRNDE